MSHHDKLCKIDIPKARAEMLKSIAECRRMHRLSQLMEQFFTSLIGKKIDTRQKDKLRDLLQKHAPELRVYRVDYKTSGKPEIGMGGQRYGFTVNMYDMEQESHLFMFCPDDGDLSIHNTLAGHRKWAQHADFLESKLPRFAYNAGKFNDMVHALQQMCEEALPAGEHFPVHPLSKFYHWYQLHA